MKVVPVLTLISIIVPFTNAVFICKLKPGILKVLSYGDNMISDGILLTDNPGNLDDYEAIEEDTPMHVTADTQGVYFWNLDRINQHNLPLDKLNYNATETNKSIVYVFGTGINDNHNEFESRVIENVNVVDDSGTNDVHSHETHVAGTCCGKTVGSSRPLIVNVKCMNDQGSGSSASIIKGLEWVKKYSLKHPGKNHILNLSLGGGYSKLFNDEINKMADLGFHIVVAAGNSAKDACQTSPASAEKAITVGATNDKDQIAYFSNTGECVNIYAPGRSIVSTDNRNNFGFRIKSGTSCSSPLVAGAIASHLHTHDSFNLTDIIYKSNNMSMLYLKEIIRGCEGEPCNFEGYCRSKWGFCGPGRHCDKDSIWSEKCGPIVPCKESKLVCLDK